jgi:hypothetical protein
MRRYAMVGLVCLVSAFLSSYFGLARIYEREQHPVAYARQQCVEWLHATGSGECIGDYLDRSFWRPGQPWVFLGFVSAVIALVCLLMAWRRAREGASSERANGAALSPT